ncbi:MAG TPA: YciI family protein [Chloroflexota bacterium]|nr:YciI family protein [Chloroflexota bacterium]
MKAVWYLVLSRRVRMNAETEPRTPAHRDWLDAQHRAGRLLFSGPTTDGAYGVYIVLADSLADATRIAGEDPYHVYGDRQMQILEWRAHRAMRLDGPTIEEIEAIARKPG